MVVSAVVVVFDSTVVVILSNVIEVVVVVGLVFRAGSKNGISLSIVGLLSILVALGISIVLLFTITSKTKMI